MAGIWTLADPLWSLIGRRRRSVGKLGERRTLVCGDMISLAASNLILRRLGGRMMRMALVVEIMSVNPDNRPADVAGLRVPPDPIANLESFNHLRFPIGPFQSGL